MSLHRLLSGGLTLLLVLSGDRASAGPDAGPAPDAGAVQKIQVVRVQDLLLEAVKRYQRSEFAAARALLKEILGYVGKEASRAAQQAHTYMAFVQIAYGETGAAIASFERALTINPTLELSAPAPKIASVFNQARRRYRARVRALDHDPPVLVHSPRVAARYGKPVAVAVTATDVSGVKRVALHYRTAGNRGFSTVSMERGARGRYLATIPTLAVVRPGIQYYLAAWDALGNGPGLKGSAGAPIEIKVKGGPRAAAAAAGPRPWYKRWWVWAIVSGAVITAGGIGTAVYLTRDEQARFSVRFPADLNPPVKSK